MQVGDKYRFLGVNEDSPSFGPWTKGGECEGKIVEIQHYSDTSLTYPIEIMLFDEGEVEWPEDWNENARRFAVSANELAPVEAKPIAHWR